MGWRTRTDCGGNRNAQRNPRPPERSAAASASTAVSLSMRAPTGSLPVVLGPFGQDLRYGRRPRARQRLIHEIREFRRHLGGPSTTHPRGCCRGAPPAPGGQSPPDPGSATAPIRPARRASSMPARLPRCPGIRRRQNETPRGTAASLLIHRPSCKHESRLADASTGGISRFSRPLWAKRRIGGLGIAPIGTYPRVSKFGGPFRPPRPQPVHELVDSAPSPRSNRPIRT
jgi:hypothetical protein